MRKRVKGCAEEQAHSFQRNANQERYYSSEDVEEVMEMEEARLTPEETSRTMVEVLPSSS